MTLVQRLDVEWNENRSHMAINSAIEEDPQSSPTTICRRIVRRQSQIERADENCLIEYISWCQD